jgi:hypothetical protein
MDANVFNLRSVTEWIVVILIALVVLYVIVWVTSRAFHDAKYNAVAGYHRKLARRQRKRSNDEQA